MDESQYIESARAAAAQALDTTPQADDYELRLASSVAQEELAREKAFAILRPDHFRNPEARAIYAAALAIENAGQPVDMLTIISRLSAEGNLAAVGGRVRAIELMSRLPYSNPAYYAAVVYDKWAARQAMAVGGRLAQECLNPAKDIADTISDAEDELTP